MKLTNIDIDNFRGIRHARVSFPEESRIICFIGPGDSGKSTLLTAIEWALWPSWNLVATDVDFYNRDTKNPIVITVSMTELPDSLIKEDKFGLCLRDLDKAQKGGENDEPTDGGVMILTVRLTIDESLEPKWEVITNRNEPCPISYKDRRLLSIGVVGFDYEKDFLWGRDSVLQKYTDSKDVLHDAFTKAMRAAVENTRLDPLDVISSTMKEIGEKYGVGFNGDIYNRLLMQNGYYSSSVAVFDGEVPFSQRGLGSKRLLSIGMNVNAYDDGTLVLIDEVETGLEPYRIITLINQFRSQFKSQGQLLMTTHSRSVVCECGIKELCVLNNVDGELHYQNLDVVPDILDDVQALLRGEPDAFLCKRIIVCEGKTEVGFLRAFDSYLHKKTNTRMAYYGVGAACGGGGNKSFKLAKLLKACGYDACILMDSDVEAEEAGKKEMENLGISVFSWDKGFSIEEQIFHDSFVDICEDLIQIAVEEKSYDHVITKLDDCFKNKQKPYYVEGKTIKLNENVSVDVTTAIGTISKKKDKCEWYKRIDLGERVGELVFDELEELEDCTLKRVITGLQEWVTGHES